MIVPTRALFSSARLTPFPFNSPRVLDTYLLQNLVKETRAIVMSEGCFERDEITFRFPTSLLIPAISIDALQERLNLSC